MASHIQLFRNSTVFASKDDTIAAMTTQAASVLDGTPILGRYTSGTEVRSLLGLVHKDVSGKTGITILSDTSDIDELTNKINNLDVTDSAVANQYVSAVSQADGKITVSRVALPVHGVTDTVEAGKFVTGLALDGGVVKASRAAVTSSQVTRTAGTGNVGGATVEAALGDLKGKIDAATTGAAVTVSAATTASDGMLKTYEVKQGGSLVGKIDIPKDFLVKSGSVVKGTFDDSGKFTESTAGPNTAIKLVINAKDDNGTGSPIYINAASLVDVYEGVTGNTVNVTVNGYNISADLAATAKTRINAALTGVTVNDQTAGVTNNRASVTLDATHVKFSTDYTPNTSGVVRADTSIEANVKALEQAVLDNEQTIAASENSLNDRKVETINITGGTVNGAASMQSGKTANIVINGGTVTVASLPTATGPVAVGDTIDTALAKLGKSSSADGSKVGNIIDAVGLGTDGKYAKTTGATTSTATSTKDAIEKLDAAVVANDKKHTITSPKSTISVSTDANGTTLDVQFDGKTIKQDTDKKLYVDTIDCGTY